MLGVRSKSSDFIAQLCTRIGIEMEDASTDGFTGGGMSCDVRGAALTWISNALERTQALLAAALVLDT